MTQLAPASGETTVHELIEATERKVSAEWLSNIHSPQTPADSGIKALTSEASTSL